MKSYQCTDYTKPRPYMKRPTRCGHPLPHEARSRLVYLERLSQVVPVLTVDVTGLCGPCVEETMREKWPADAGICEHWIDHPDGTKTLWASDTAAPVAVDNFPSKEAFVGRGF